jgi:hypothetical protein
MRFDFYNASIDADPRVIIDYLESSLDLADVVPTSPRNGYQMAYKLVRGDNLLSTVMWGGQNVGNGVWASATGENAPEFAELIREKFQDHRLLRADIAIDYCESGAWESLSSHALATADRHNLKVEHRGDFHREIGGRTIYVGSRKSAAYQRTYEKGKQLGADPDYVRVELELKPQNLRAKELYAAATPEQMLMATRWTQDYYTILADITGIRPIAPGTIRKKSDDERAMEHMFKQYGHILRRKLESMGGDAESFGMYIAGLLPPANG